MNDETTIYPTNSCFDDSVANLVPLIQENGSRLTDGSLLIVHGIIDRSADGKPIAHAWLELDGQYVIDSGILQGRKITYRAELQEYYRQSNARDVTKYMPVDAAHLEIKTKQFGPWEPRYQALCDHVNGSECDDDR